MFLPLHLREDLLVSNMCFRTKDGARILISRRYVYLSGVYTIGLRINKKVDRTLFIDVENKNGDLSFELTNKTTGEINSIKNVSTGNYSFSILKENAYQIRIIPKKCSGHYKVTIKKQ